MQTISTGYQPEFGLGALYAGQNAANSQAINDEELAKLFLANQQAQQTYNQAERTNPLDIIKRSQENQVGAYDAALANAKRTSPSYIPHVLSGYEGQMKSQWVSGKIAEALMPKKIETEQITQDVEQQKQNALWTLQDLDKKITSGRGVDDRGIAISYTPGQIAFMNKDRQVLANQLALTPEIVGKQLLQTQKDAAELARTNVTASATKDAAAARGTGTGSKPNAAYQLLEYRRIANDPTEPPEKRKLAQGILTSITDAKILGNPAAYQRQMDLAAAGGLPMLPSLAETIAEKPRTTPEPTTPVVKNEFQLLAEKEGIPYEPTKYIYRVGDNGKLQRKAK